MVIIGHSYGGFVTTCAAKRHPELIAVGLLAPWDADDLRAALAKIPAAYVSYRLFDTDHGFNDQRIALETYVLNWLGSLAVAPTGR